MGSILEDLFSSFLISLGNNIFWFTLLDFIILLIKSYLEQLKYFFSENR